MSDIYCRKCGEPWDNYGITIDKGDGDMTLEEVDRFRKGEGCPSCGFGSKCTHCHGTGLEPGGSFLAAACKACHDQHYTFVYQSKPEFIGSDWGKPYYLGGLPFLPTEYTVLEAGKAERRSTGYERSLKILCPECKLAPEPCSVCKGDRQWHSQRAEQAAMDIHALASLLDASDEEPIGLIDTFLGGE